MSWSPRRLLVAILLIFGAPWTASAYFNGQPTAQLFGQLNFTDTPAANQGLPAPSSKTLSAPRDIFCDVNYVYILDAGNNRVLVYSTAAVNTPGAVAVIGQPNFTQSSPNQGGTAGPATTHRTSTKRRKRL